MPWAPAYITPAALAAYVRVGDLVDEVEMVAAIEAASRAIDRHCSGDGGTLRQFGRVDTAQVRRYIPWYDDDLCRWVLDVDDLGDVDGVVVTGADGVAVDPAAVEFDPPNALADGMVYTRVLLAVGNPGRRVDVLARWGWPAVPVAVELACRLQASRFLSRRDSPYGVAGSPELGSELRLLARVDPDVGVSVGRYIRPMVVA